MSQISTQSSSSTSKSVASNKNEKSLVKIFNFDNGSTYISNLQAAHTYLYPIFNRYFPSDLFHLFFNYLFESMQIANEFAYLKACGKELNQQYLKANNLQNSSACWKRMKKELIRSDSD